MDYSDNKYNRQIRISDELLDYLRTIKGRGSLAGKLEEIINQYRDEHSETNKA
jgi:hypothetical protein